VLADRFSARLSSLRACRCAPDRRARSHIAMRWPSGSSTRWSRSAFLHPAPRDVLCEQRARPLLWLLPHTPLLRWIVFVGWGSPLSSRVGGMIRPSPAGVVPVPVDALWGRSYRITRHPVMMADSALGLVHLLPNGSTPTSRSLGASSLPLCLCGAPGSAN